MRKRTRKSIAIVLAIVSIAVAIYFMGDFQQAVFLDSKTSCTLNEEQKFMTCPFDSRTISASGGDAVLINLYQKAYQQYVTTHSPAIANITGVTSDYKYPVSGLVLCTISGNFLNCDLGGFYGATIKGDHPERLDNVHGITVYFTDSGFRSLDGFCPQEGAESCTGTELITCTNHLTKNMGNVDGKCGYTAKATVVDSPASIPETDTDTTTGSTNTTTTTTTTTDTGTDTTTTTTTDTGTDTDTEDPESEPEPQPEPFDFTTPLFIIAAILIVAVVILSIRRRK